MFLSSAFIQVAACLPAGIVAPPMNRVGGRGEPPG